MVYSSAPARILYSGEVKIVGEDDNLSLWTSSDNSKSTLEGKEPDTKITWNESFEAFVHQNHSKESYQVEDHDAFNVDALLPNSYSTKGQQVEWNENCTRLETSALLPPLENPRQEEYNHQVYLQDKGQAGMACHSHCMSSISCLAPWGGVNTRARIEMMQHQLGKPFRALSGGKRIMTRTRAFNSAKQKDVGLMPIPGNVTDKGESSQRSTKNQSRIDSSGNPHHACNDQRNQERISLWAEDKCDDVKEFRSKDSHWRYSCDLWTNEKHTSMDPPGHYYETQQAIRFHFYNDFSVAINQENIFAAEPSRGNDFSVVATPTFSTAENSDDDSFFVLQDGLD